jgi:hypothetical protein
MKLSWLATLALLVVHSAYSAEPITLNGLKLWSATEAEVHKAYPNFSCAKGNLPNQKADRICFFEIERVCIGAKGTPSNTACRKARAKMYQYETVPIQYMWALFFDDKLGKVIMGFERESFGELASTLRARLGKPGADEATQRKAKTGESYEHFSLRWRRGDALLVLENHRPGMQAEIMLLSVAAHEEQGRRGAK